MREWSPGRLRNYESWPHKLVLSMRRLGRSGSEQPVRLSQKQQAISRRANPAKQAHGLI
jgi:hypothetical protein